MHYVQVQIGAHTVPVVSLELQLATELFRDRPDRYTPLIRHLRRHGPDLQLLVKAMRAYELNPALQERVVGELQQARTR